MGERVAVGVAVVLLAGCGDSKNTENRAADGDAKPRVAVIPKGSTHAFWKSVEAGAKQAGNEFGLDVIWKGPMKEDDRASQIQLLEQFISEGVAGIVLAPLDSQALVVPVQSAKEKKIATVIFDSTLEGNDCASFVATDNKAAGKLGGDHLAKLLGGTGKVVLLRYLEGSASTMQREAGFLEAMAANPGITVISKDQYAGATSASAKDRAMNMLDTLREADGIFAPNESSAVGMLLALQDNGLAGKKTFVGFDASEMLLQGLANGEIMGLVAQNPRKMGYIAVKTMAAVLKGEQVDAVIDTGCALITKDNMASPEIQAILGK
ncbi:MAG: substrate-binding domain-containing protein [Lentisphaerae bacterium]|nr:substrate-binding domain-containing protein [Lentisphaerota bacterium]